MHRGHRIVVLVTVMLAAYTIFEREAWCAPSATVEPGIKAIQVLDTAAKDAEDRVRERCGDAQAGADLEAETSALNAAHIHLERMHRAREMKIAATDLAAVAIEAATDFQRAYLCNRVAVAHLDMAIRVLTALRADLPEDAAHVRDNIDRELADVVALKNAHVESASSAAQMSVPSSRVEVVVVDAGEVTIATPRSNTFLGRLALRLDLGFGTTNLGLETEREVRHRGFYFRAQFLARFTPGKRDRVLLLFGPFYNILSARTPIEPSLGSTASFANMHGFGTHFELQWNPRRAAPWLSLHPFLDIGIEFISESNNAGVIRFQGGGFQGGGGTLVCVVHASICPNIRIMSVPQVESKDHLTVQVGVALDVLRWVDLSLSRRRPSARASVPR